MKLDGKVLLFLPKRTLEVPEVGQDLIDGLAELQRRAKGHSKAKEKARKDEVDLSRVRWCRWRTFTRGPDGWNGQRTWRWWQIRWGAKYVQTRAGKTGEDGVKHLSVYPNKRTAEMKCYQRIERRLREGWSER